MKKSLRKSLTVRGIFAILRPILWYGFFTFTILRYTVFGKYDVDPRNPLVYVGAFFILTVPFFSDWIARALRTPPFEGEVIRIKARTFLKGDTFVAKYSQSHRIVSEYTYFIRTRGGRRIRYRIKEPNFEYAHRFSVGTKVRHRFGAPFFELSEHTVGDDYLCIICGTLCREEQDICFECRSALDKDGARRAKLGLGFSEK